MDMSEYGTLLNQPLEVKIDNKVPDYDQALRARLMHLNGMGESQNQFAQQQSLQAYQKQLDSQYASAKSNYESKASQFNPSNFIQQNGGQGQQVDNATGFVSSKNPRNAQEAIQYAKQAAANGDSNWYRMCLAFVANAYGLPASGIATARQGWDYQSDKHTDFNAPAGALMFWDTGPGRAGHVAINVGNGMVASNDIMAKGKISIVPASLITQKWGSTYLGWSSPNFATTPRR